MQRELQRDFDMAPPGCGLSKVNPSDATRRQPGMPLGAAGYTLLSHMQSLVGVDNRKDLVILKRQSRKGLQEATYSLTRAGRSLAQTLHREAEEAGYCRCGQLEALPNGATHLPPDYDHLTMEQCKEGCKARGIRQSGKLDEVRRRLLDHDCQLRDAVEASQGGFSKEEWQGGASEEPETPVTVEVASSADSSTERTVRVVPFTSVSASASVATEPYCLSHSAKAALLQEMDVARQRVDGHSLRSPRSVAELVARDGWLEPQDGYPIPNPGAPGTAERPITLGSDDD